MFDKIDYKTVRLAGREVRLTINHSERSISARLNDSCLTGYLSKHLALGASVRLEYGSDEDMLAGLYLGPLRLYAGINNRLLGSILGAVKLGRRMTSIEIDLANRYEPDEGAAVKVRGHLWDDDNRCSAESRSFSVDLLDAVLGKPVTSEKVIVEERDAVVPLPEGNFTTKARLVERFVQRPGWPFKRFSRWVELRETPAVVPQKGGGTSFYNMGGPWTGVTGNSIDDGVAEFVRRVLEQRSRYGGKAWATGVPAATNTRDSHEVSVWEIVDGKEQEVWRGDIGHETALVKGKPRDEFNPDSGLFFVKGLDVRLGRHPVHGGVVAYLGDFDALVRPGHIIQGPTSEPAAVMHGDEFHRLGQCWKIYGSPIGPAPVPNTTQSGSVNAFDILAAAKQAGLHGVNAGPTIGHRVGRHALQGLPAAHALLAEELDPQWFAANAEIVDGARKVHDASTFDVETRSWIEPSAADQEAMLGSAREAFERGQEWMASRTERADVQEVLAELDTTPPGPTEEADGLSLRERALAGARRPRFGVDLAAGGSDQTVTPGYVIQDGVLHRVGEPRVLDPAYIGEVSRQYAQAFDAGQTAVSALSAVLGNGEADFSPAPVDTRPWMPTGDLVVVVARGELRQTIRLDCAPSHRIGAHKDAEVRLLGAHTIAATLLQQDGAVWICRGADNVAVDLLGLDIRETVRLREGAEVQIGQLYTLTITSRSA